MKPTSSSSKSSSSTSSTWSIEVKHNDGMKNDESSLSSPPKRLVWCCKSFLMTKMDSDGYKGVKRWSKKAKLNFKIAIVSITITIMVGIYQIYDSNNTKDTYFSKLDSIQKTLIKEDDKK